MGCDIFLYFEEKDDKDRWKEIEVTPRSILPEGRHYYAWSFLFGVRDCPEFGLDQPLFARRGLPDDFSIKDVREDYENLYSDLHSWTYIYANEVENIEWPDDLKDCYFKVFLEWVFPQIYTSYELPENLRMTVCFHN